MRALLILLLLAAPATAQEGCAPFCGDGAEAGGAGEAARLAGWLGIPLPYGAVVENYREEGFQDSFVRARLDVDAKGLAAILRAAGVAPEAMGEADSAESEGDPAWWDWKLREGVRTGEGALPLLPYVTLHVAPAAPGRWTIYLTGFQT